MIELFWGAFTLFAVAFVLYAAAHSWLIRPILRRIWPGFPWLDVVLPPKNEDFWETLRKDRERGR